MLLSLLLPLPPTVSAASREVADLYAATVTLADGQRQPDAATARNALEQVLVRVTGRRDIATRPEALAVLDQAERLIQQQGMQTRRDARYVFDERVVRRAVYDAGLPYWEADRPVALIWLLAELPPRPPSAGDVAAGASPMPDAGRGAVAGEAPGAGDRRRFLAAGEDNELAARLFAVAAERGLPVELPAMDVLDEAVASAADLATGFAAPLVEASRRYGAGAVLAGVATQAPSGYWFVEWQLVGGPQDGLRWQGDAGDGVEYLADVLSARYASIVGQTALGVPLQVDTVPGMREYARTLAWFDRLDLVERVTLERVRGDTLFFTLLTRADPVKLGRLVELAEFLQPAAPAAAAASADSPLRFAYREPPAYPAALPDGMAPEDDGGLLRGTSGDAAVGIGPSSSPSGEDAPR